MLVDCHVHLQPHGEKPPMTRERIAEYLRVAQERGVDAICITEHLFRFEEAYRALYGWWDADQDQRLAGMVARYWKDHVSGSVADYVRVVEAAKSAGLPVYLGLEMDWLPGKSDILREFLAPYDWDVVLGSVHYIGAWGIDDDEFLFEWENRDVAQAWDKYGALMRELAETGLADVLTHPDVVKKFGHRPTDETPLHAAIVEGAASTGAAIELNTNGLRRCKEIFPARPLVERAKAAGLPITLASDAHYPKHVGHAFDEAAAWARRAGYEEASYYVGRKRESYPLK
ncbi:MAG: histidinol-phosphatase HisJ family protein [Chloroflexi bacterium]|nr:histidinol-phosphatase HisJ family protein [Chloroflexota bacterium]